MSIKPSVNQSIKRLLRKAGYHLISADRFEHLEAQAVVAEKVGHLGMIPPGELSSALDLIGDSLSQLNQDFFVLHETGWKRDGYFVEFGATDGRSYNNTWLLEKKFGWTGILGEPARMWRKALEASGRTAELEFDCVWSSSGETLTFSEASRGELSTLDGFRDADSHQRDRVKSYPVATVSLSELLARHNAPPVIDYLSIDTEGTEYEILKAFDFDKYRFACITCEHNYTPNRELIHRLLTDHGYRRKFEDHSQFDDWYVFDG